MNKKFYFLIFLSMIFITSCSNSLAQKPINITLKKPIFIEQITANSPTNPELNDGDEKELQKLIADITGIHPNITPPKPLQKSKNFNIALLLPLSGELSHLGKEMLLSSQIALDELSEDRNIVITPYDTKANAQDTINAYKQAVTNKSNIILGPLLSKNVKAVEKEIGDNDVGILAFSNDSSIRHKNIKLLGMDITQQVKKLTETAIDKGFRDFYLLAPDSNFGKIVHSDFKRILQNHNIKIHEAQFYKEEDINLSRKIKNITIHSNALENKKKAILIPEGGRVMNLIIPRLKSPSLGDKNLQIMTIHNLQNSANKDNLIGSWFTTTQIERENSFKNRLTKLNKSESPTLSSLAYDATALAILMSQNLTEKSNNINYLVNERGYNGVHGSFKFTNSPIAQRDYFVAEVTKKDLKIIAPASRDF